MTIQVYKIGPKDSLRVLVEDMRTLARQDYQRTLPIYSTSFAEASLKARAYEEELLQIMRYLQFSDLPNDFVSLALSVDAFPDQPLCWHLSMALAAEARNQEPRRVPDAIAQRIAKEFEVPDEGKPEGIFKKIRHFRGPFQP